MEDGRGYVEVPTPSDALKTGRVRRKRRRQVPFVGNALGVLGRPWAQEWLRLRKLHGLCGEADGSLMPAPERGGGWSRCSLEIAEANAWLVEFLTRVGRPLEERSAVGTHSCKATALSWAAKGGMKAEHPVVLWILFSDPGLFLHFIYIYIYML